MTTASTPRTTSQLPARAASASAARPSTLSRWTRRHRSPLLGVAGVLIVLACWQLCVALGLVDVTFSSSPVRIAVAEVHLFGSGEIYPALAATGNELAWGLFITVVLGIPIG